jgi:hypothetical protein
MCALIGNDVASHVPGVPSEGREGRAFVAAGKCVCGCGTRTKKRDENQNFNAHLKQKPGGVCRDRQVGHERRRRSVASSLYKGHRLRGKTATQHIVIPSGQSPLQLWTPSRGSPSVPGTALAVDPGPTPPIRVGSETSLDALEAWLVAIRADVAEPIMGKATSYMWLASAMTVMDQEAFQKLVGKFMGPERSESFRAALAVFAAKLNTPDVGGAVRTFRQRLLATILDVAAVKEADLRLLQAVVPASDYVDLLMT